MYPVVKLVSLEVKSSPFLKLLTCDHFQLSDLLLLKVSLKKCYKASKTLLKGSASSTGITIRPLAFVLAFLALQDGSGSVHPCVQKAWPIAENLLLNVDVIFHIIKGCQSIFKYVKQQYWGKGFHGLSCHIVSYKWIKLAQADSVNEMLVWKLHPYV